MAETDEQSVGAHVGCNDWLSGVWVVLDHRHEPDRLIEKVAYDNRDAAEARAYLLRQHYRCSLDAIQVYRLDFDTTGNDTTGQRVAENDRSRTGTSGGTVADVPDNSGVGQAGQGTEVSTCPCDGDGYVCGQHRPPYAEVINLLVNHGSDESTDIAHTIAKWLETADRAYLRGHSMGFDCGAEWQKGNDVAR